MSADRTPPPATVPAPAVLYSRQGCSPCFAMRRAAARAARRSGIPLDIVDIDGDPDLAARYGTEVPVLVLPGGTTFKGRAAPGAIEAAFRAAAAAVARRPGVAGRARRVVTSFFQRIGTGRKEPS